MASVLTQQPDLILQNRSAELLAEERVGIEVDEFEQDRKESIVASSKASLVTQVLKVASVVAKSWWKTVAAFAVIVLLLPIPLVMKTPAANAAYVIFIIAVYWMSEALPLVVTSLLPLILFPALGVLTASEVSSSYINDTSWLLIAGLMIAIAVERWDLHKRLALLVLLLMGSRPSMLLLGFMCSTGFLSMWLNNTATAAMMFPIAQAVLREFEMCSKEVKSGNMETVGYVQFENDTEEVEIGDLEKNEQTLTNRKKSRNQENHISTFTDSASGDYIAVAEKNDAYNKYRSSVDFDASVILDEGKKNQKRRILSRKAELYDICELGHLQTVPKCHDQTVESESVDTPDSVASHDQLNTGPDSGYHIESGDVKLTATYSPSRSAWDSEMAVSVKEVPSNDDTEADAVYPSTEGVNKSSSLSSLEEAEINIAGAGNSGNSISPRKAEEGGKEAKRKNVSKTGTVKRLGKGLMIGVAYTANIGGMATLTGSGPNLVLRGVVQSLFPQSAGINFGVWFVFGVPTAFLALAGTWLYLTLLFCDDSLLWLKKRFCTKWSFQIIDREKGLAVIRAQYRLLGPIKYAEVVVLLLFVLLALLWFLRDPKFMPGWGALFPSDQNGASYVSDATAAVSIALLLFIIPSKPCFTCRKFRNCFCSKQTCADTGRAERLLSWWSVQQHLPWDVILILGSGFAMARAAQCSGLSLWIEETLVGLKELPVSLVAFVVSCLAAIVTQVMVNVASTTLILPIVAQLGVSLGVNPLYLMIPATLATSLACVLPVSSTPTAMVYPLGYMRVSEMFFTGLPVAALGIAVLNFALNSYGVPLFSLASVQDWSTSAANITAANSTYLSC